MCRFERWDVRTLRKKIGGMLFERTALSKNTKAVISAEIANLRDGRMTPDAVFRDPYFLAFAGWTNTNAPQGRNRPSASSSVPRPMPSRWNFSSSMPDPSA